MKIFIVLLSFQIFLKSASAGGLDNNTTFGARTFSLNGLYFAGTMGLSSILSNPASLLFLSGKGIEINVIDRVEQAEFESPSRGPHKTFKDDNLSLGGGFFWNLSEGITVGAVYQPFVNYKADWPFAYYRTTDTSSFLQAFNMRNRISINAISPSAAFSIGPLNIGLSANIYQVLQEIQIPLTNENWGQNSGQAAYQFKVDQEGWTFGGTLGILYDLNDELRAGLSVKSGFKASMDGDAETFMFRDIDSISAVRVNASSDFEIPWKFGLGFLYKISSNFNLNIDAGYSLWGSINKTQDFIFEDPVWQNRTSRINSLPGFAPNSISTDFENSFDAGIGAEYIPENGWKWRAGYRFSQGFVSPSSYGFLFPSVDQHIFSLGVGYTEGNLTFDAGIAYIYGPVKNISSSENIFLSGSYSASGYIPSVSLRYEFK